MTAKQYAKSILGSIRHLSDNFSYPIPCGKLRPLCEAVLAAEEHKPLPPLSKTEQRVWCAIKEDFADGIQPTIRSLQKRLGYKSPDTPAKYVSKLLLKGYIRKEGRGSQKKIVIDRRAINH